MSAATPAGFLRARLDEQEAGAREVLAHNARSRVRGLTSTVWDEEDADADAELREVAAKREILRMAAEWDRYSEWDRVTLDAVIEHLAAAYNHHPDYRPEWAP